MDDLIKKHEAENIHPTQFAQALKDVKSAREALVNISELAEAITAFEAVNEMLLMLLTRKRWMRPGNCWLMAAKLRSYLQLFRLKMLENN